MKRASSASYTLVELFGVRIVPPRNNVRAVPAAAAAADEQQRQIEAVEAFSPTWTVSEPRYDASGRRELPKGNVADVVRNAVINKCYEPRENNAADIFGLLKALAGMYGTQRTEVTFKAARILSSFDGSQAGPAAYEQEFALPDTTPDLVRAGSGERRVCVEVRWPVASPLLEYRVVVKLPSRLLQDARNGMQMSRVMLPQQQRRGDEGGGGDETHLIAALNLSYSSQTVLYAPTNTIAGVRIMRQIVVTPALLIEWAGNEPELCSMSDDGTLMLCGMQLQLEPSGLLRVAELVRRARVECVPSALERAGMPPDLLVLALHDELAVLRRIFTTDHVACALIAVSGAYAVRTIAELARNAPHTLCFGALVAKAVVAAKPHAAATTLCLIGKVYRDLSFDAYERWIALRVRQLAAATSAGVEADGAPPLLCFSTAFDPLAAELVDMLLKQMTTTVDTIENVRHVRECLAASLFRSAAIVYRMWIVYNQHGQQTVGEDGGAEDEGASSLSSTSSIGKMAADHVRWRVTTGHAYSINIDEAARLIEACNVQELALEAMLRFVPAAHCPLRVSSVARCAGNEHMGPILRQKPAVATALAHLYARAALTWLVVHGIVCAETGPPTRPILLAASTAAPASERIGAVWSTLAASSVAATRFYTLDAWSNERTLATTFADMITLARQATPVAEPARTLTEVEFLCAVRARLRARIERYIRIAECHSPKHLKLLLEREFGEGTLEMPPLHRLCLEQLQQAALELRNGAPQLVSMARFADSHAPDIYSKRPLFQQLIPKDEVKREQSSLAERIIIDPSLLPHRLALDPSRVSAELLDKLDEHQRAAIDVIAREPLVSISGLGGCGKTQALTVALRMMGPRQTLTLCEMGRSCSVVRTRVAATLHVNATVLTLHRAIAMHRRAHALRTWYELAAANGEAHFASLLSVSPALSLKFARALIAESPFDNARGIIIDESSLVSSDILAEVMQVAHDRRRTFLERIVFVGCHEQLPCVAWGRPYRDLMLITQALRSACLLRINHRARGRSIVENAAAMARYHEQGAAEDDGSDGFIRIDTVPNEYSIICMDDMDDMEYANGTLIPGAPWTSEQIETAVAAGLCVVARRWARFHHGANAANWPEAKWIAPNATKWMRTLALWSEQSAHIVAHTTELARAINRIVRAARFDVNPAGSLERHPPAVFPTDKVYICENSRPRLADLFDSPERQMARLRAVELTREQVADAVEPSPADVMTGGPRFNEAMAAAMDNETRIENELLELSNGEILRVVRFYDQPQPAQRNEERCVCRCGACEGGVFTCLDPTQVPPARREPRDDEPPHSTWRHPDPRYATSTNVAVPPYRVLVYQNDAGELREVPADRIFGSRSSFCFGYGTTVHKAQGTGCGDLVFVAPKDTAFTTFELPYTATTRAESSVSVLTTKTTPANRRQSSNAYPTAFHAMCHRPATVRRSTLAPRTLGELAARAAMKAE